jgi:sugar phosphate isomerase/epimerase
MKIDERTMTRREALAALGLLAFSAKSALTASAQAPATSGIALQLYTMRDPAKKDLVGTLKKCREMGWEYVQWSGMPPSLTAEQIRAALDEAGLKCIACHTGMEAFEKDFEKNVKFWKTVGNKDIAPGGMMNDCKKDLQAWLRGCKRLDDLGAKLKEVGMRLSYHNHTTEFQKYPGDDRYPLDILMDTAKNVNMELDVAWAYAAGISPAEHLLKYYGRCPVIHVKDIKGKGHKVQFQPLGQGDVPLKEVIAAGKKAGVEWFVYEQDGGKGSPFDYAAASYEFLKKNM